MAFNGLLAQFFAELRGEEATVFREALFGHFVQVFLPDLQDVVPVVVPVVAIAFVVSVGANERHYCNATQHKKKTRQHKKQDNH